jgi:hypothetical protein
LSHTPGPFLLWQFSVMVSHFCPGWSCSIPSSSRDHRYVHYHSWLTDWDGGLTKFLPGLISNCDPSYLHLPGSWDYMCELPHPAIILTMIKHMFKWHRFIHIVMHPSPPSIPTTVFIIPNQGNNNFSSPTPTPLAPTFFLSLRIWLLQIPRVSRIT